MPVIDVIAPGVRVPSLLERADRFPPILCRALAKRGGYPATLEELARRTGWSAEKVKYISNKTSWATVPLEDVVIFSNACKVNLGHQVDATRRFKRLLKAGFPHLDSRFKRKFIQMMDALPPGHAAQPENRDAWRASRKEPL